MSAPGTNGPSDGRAIIVKGTDDYPGALTSITKSAALYFAIHMTIASTPLQRLLPTPAKCIFLINSVFSSAVGARVLVSDTAGDFCNWFPDWLQSGLSLFGGYVLYDLVSSPRNISRDVFVHHVFALCGVLAELGVRKLAFLPGAVLVTESSLVPLLVYQRLRDQGYDRSHARFRAAVWARMIVVLSCRTFVAPYVAYRAVSSLKQEVAETEEKSPSHVTLVDVWRRLKSRVPRWAITAAGCNLLTFATLNLVWTWQTASTTRRLLWRRRVSRRS